MQRGTPSRVAERILYPAPPLQWAQRQVWKILGQQGPAEEQSPESGTPTKLRGAWKAETAQS